MPSFLSYAPQPQTAVGRYRAQATPKSAAHPSVVSYLSQGMPLRQGFMEALQGKAKPNMVAPPGGGGVKQATEPTGWPNTTAQQPGASPYTGYMPDVKPGGDYGFGLTGSAVPPGGTTPVPQGAPQLSYLADTVLQRAMAARDAALKTARGNAVGDYESLLLGFGSQQMARDFLSKTLASREYADAAGVGQTQNGKLDPTIEKFLSGISDNPDTSQSTLAQLARALRGATENTNESLSSSAGGNLFFSGARARGLRDLNYESQGQVSDATRALQQALGGITRGVTGLEGEWSSSLLGVESDAYTRALNAQLAADARASGQAPGTEAGAGAGAPPEPGTPVFEEWKARQAAYKKSGQWTAGL